MLAVASTTAIRTSPRLPVAALPAPSSTLLRAFMLACAVLAFAVRLARGGGIPGLWSYDGYDDGVYFGAAVSLAHGRVPYRDFLLLHPPGLMLALTPFAELTHWMSDAHAFVAARLGWMALGALNTVLVMLVASRWGRRPAITAGILYAVLPVVTVGEYTTMIEPLGTAALLGAVLLARRAERAGASEWWSVAVGVAVGVAPVTKIWGVVTVAVVLAWHAWRMGVRAGARAAAGAAATAVVVLGPFAVLAGRALWRDVVGDQLGRPAEGVAPASRLESLTGAGASPLPASAHLALACVLAAVVVGCGLLAWRTRTGRLWSVLLAAQGCLLLVTPSFYPYYAALLGPAMVLVVAAAVRAVPVRARTLAVVATCLGFGLTTAPGQFHAPRPFPAAQVRAMLPQAGCVRSDSPGALVLLDVLSRDLDRGCTVAIDLSGTWFDEPVVVRSQVVSRRDNPRYQDAVVDYLSTGGATVLVRAGGDGFSTATTKELARGRTLDRFPDNVRVLAGGRPPASR